MKKALLLGAGLAAGCVSDSHISVYDNENYEFDKDLQFEPCKDELADGIVAFDRFDPNSFPLDVAHITEDYELVEVFTGYRDQLEAVFTMPNMDGSYRVYKAPLSTVVTEAEFAEAPLSFENGDFAVEIPLGSFPILNSFWTSFFITNQDCSEFYGFATYDVSGNLPDDTVTLTSYLNEDGYIVQP